MKVICIKNGEWNWTFNPKRPRPKTDPSFGEIVTVINTVDILGYTTYNLKEYPHLYNSRMFIPTSDIDEKEFIREYKTHIV